jgi:hypothetical protein
MRDPKAPPGTKPEPDAKPGDFWTRWRFVAALFAVLLALPAGRQVYYWYAKSRDAKDKVAARDTTRAAFEKLLAEQKVATDAARADFDKARAAEELLQKQHEEALQKARKLLEEKDFTVRLTGPAHVQPGAPNRWKVEALDSSGAPAKVKKLEVVVKDAKNAELLKQTHEQPTASTNLELPIALWANVKPGTELFLEVSALSADDRKGILSERVPLARPVFVTHLATDKPLYKPGETVRFRSLTLDRSTLTPPANDLHLAFKLRDPGDAVTQLDVGNGRVVRDLKPVNGPDGKPLRGIGVGEYALPDGAPGGEYKLDLYERDPNTGREILLETRKFIVNRYVPDTFEKKLEFDAKSYGANDTVQARVEVSRTAGGPMTDARATVTATADGKEIFKLPNANFTIVPGERGATKAILDVRFKLPPEVFAGKDVPSATLTATVSDKSDTEAIVRPIPLVAKALRVEFFPEGGDMIAGVNGRVYFQVRMPTAKPTEPGKPADLKGYITDGTNTLAEVSTVTDAENPGVNRGHGAFALAPKAGTNYFLKITSPAGITAPTPNGFPLPAVKADGVALTALDAVTEKGAAVRARLQVGQGTKTLHVGAYARGRLVAHQKVDVTAGTPVDVALKGDDTAGGVTRVTVFEEPKAEGEGRAQLQPRAERLVFRKLDQQLILNANPDKARYAPAGKVKLELSAFNEKEQATPAVLMVAVVNRSVITMADNKTDRLAPTHFLLSGEVKHPAELEHADFLLTDHPKAGVALDLLLGTQGWRRFAEQQAPQPANAADKDVDKMLVAHGSRTSAPFALYQLEETRVNAEYAPKLEQQALARAAAQAQFAKWQNSPEVVGKVQMARLTAEAATTAARTAEADLFPHETRPERPRTWVLPLLCVALVGLGIGGTALAGSRPRGARRPVYFGSFLVFALAGLSAGAIALTWETPATEVAWKQEGRDDRAKKMNAEMAMARDGAEREMAAFDAAGNAERAEWLAARPAPKAMMPAMPMAPGMGGGAMPSPAPHEPKPDAGGAPNDQKNDRDANAVPLEALKELEQFRARNEANRGAKGKGLDEAKKQLADALQSQPKRAPGAPFGPGAGPAAGGMPFPGGPVPPGGGFAGKPGRGGEFHMPPAMPFIVREYAHQRDASLGEVRADFTETVYWHPVLVLPETGKATVEFQLSDDIARYQVLVAGHTLDGRIGAITKTIESRLPFSVDPKLPLEVAHTDVIDAPLRVTNDSDDPRNLKLAATLKGFKVDGPLPDSLALAANEKARRTLRFKPDVLSGEGAVALVGTSGPDKDTIARTIRIVPDGFPGVGSVSDVLEGGRALGTVKLPKDVVPGSLKVRLEMYPTSMSDLVKGLDGLLREPSGCFEQTSTSNYPNTLILDYLDRTNQAKPDVSKRAKDLLTRGYSKLVSFECPDSKISGKLGFEWFGSPDMQHEALTAYGLLQFKDMARVHEVDAQMIQRTQAFLTSRRDGKGGFLRNARALDSFGGAPKHTTDAYIVWALVESDPDDKEKLDLSKEIAALKAQATDEKTEGGKDAYFVALVANVLLKRGDGKTAQELLDRLKDKHVKNGAVTGAVTSITRSGGRDLEIETTSITLLGWMRANNPKYATAIKDATKWISQQRGGYGGFGSTQSTIMALKALIAHAQANAHPAEAGDVKLLVNGKEIAVRKFTEKDVEVIAADVANAEEAFAFGKDTEIEVTTTAKHPYPFAVSYSYTTLTPVSSDKCAVKLGTKLGKAEAAEGEALPLHVTFENKLDKGHGMAVAIIGLPAGLKVPTDMKQLTDLREKGKIAFFETRGRELVLYWRELAPKQQIELTVDVVADVPGKYRGPASRGYLYYDADHKHWVEPLSATVTDAK